MAKKSEEVSPGKIMWDTIYPRLCLTTFLTKEKRPCRVQEAGGAHDLRGQGLRAGPQESGKATQSRA